MNPPLIPPIDEATLRRISQYLIDVTMCTNNLNDKITFLEEDVRGLRDQVTDLKDTLDWIRDTYPEVIAGYLAVQDAKKYSKEV